MKSIFIFLVLFVQTAFPQFIVVSGGGGSPVDSSNFATVNRGRKADSSRIANTANNVKGIKVYRAFLSQSGADNPPTATIVENTLGGTVVFFYGSTGHYQASLVSAFPADKTCLRDEIIIGADDITVVRYVRMRRSDDDNINIDVGEVGTPSDDILNNTYIEILVYP